MRKKTPLCLCSGVFFRIIVYVDRRNVFRRRGSAAVAGVLGILRAGAVGAAAGALLLLAVVLVGGVAAAGSVLGVLGVLGVAILAHGYVLLFVVVPLRPLRASGGG
jgi:hypothetical protein